MASTLYTSGTLVTSDSLNAFDRASYTQLTALGGTADNLTATGPVSMTAYLTGLRFVFTPSAPNTTNVTININGLGNKAITKLGNTLLIAGDLVAGKVAEIVYDGVGFQLLNPQTFNLTNSVPAANITGQVAIANGGTGASTAAQALINLGATGRLIGVQTFTANGTYTPTAGTNSIVVHVVGGGGAGGGATTTAAAQISTGCGGGSGAYSIGRFTSGFSGAAVTVGAGGIGVSGGNGGNGGTSSLGALITAPGANGGSVVPAAATLRSGGGVGGALGSGGNILQIPGSVGDHVLQGQPLALGVSGAVGPFGGKVTVVALANGINAAASAYGTGGGGGSNDPSSGVARTGGNGAPGVVIIYEYS